MRVRPSDLVVIAYLFIEAILILSRMGRLTSWPLYLVIHIALIGGALLLAAAASKSRSRILHVLRDWYPALYIPIIFVQLRILVPAVHPRTYDDLLLAWDNALFGEYPGHYLDAIASPLLTEVLRGCWLSYFVLPFILGVPLYCRRDKGAFHETVLVLVLGWLVSYLGYYALPAWGPGYFHEKVPAPQCVHDGGVTQSMALFLFSLEGKMHDIFPSGHTMIALIVLWQARRHRLRGWPLLIPLVAGLVMGTVYLRYHYGVDILAGVALVIPILWLAPRWHARHAARHNPTS